MDHIYSNDDMEDMRQVLVHVIKQKKDLDNILFHGRPNSELVVKNGKPYSF